MTRDIERVANAIDAACYVAPRDAAELDDPPLTSPSSGDLARAAIASLLPPSAAMVNAAARALYEDENGPGTWIGLYRSAMGGHKRKAINALTAAINAALGVRS